MAGAAAGSPERLHGKVQPPVGSSPPTAPLRHAARCIHPPGPSGLDRTLGKHPPTSFFPAAASNLSLLPSNHPPPTYQTITARNTLSPSPCAPRRSVPPSGCEMPGDAVGAPGSGVETQGVVGCLPRSQLGEGSARRCLAIVFPCVSLHVCRWAGAARLPLASMCLPSTPAPASHASSDEKCCRRLTSHQPAHLRRRSSSSSSTFLSLSLSLCFLNTVKKSCSVGGNSCRECVWEWGQRKVNFLLGGQLLLVDQGKKKNPQG